MYFLYSLGGVTFNKCWITLSILNCYSPNFQGFILMKNALNNQVGMLGDMFLWLVANLKQGVIYFIKQALPPNKSAGSVYSWAPNKWVYSISIFDCFTILLALFPPYLICKFSTLLVYWALFSTQLIYLALLFYEIYLKYPPYSFIWPYLFNWHLRVI